MKEIEDEDETILMRHMTACTPSSTEGRLGYQTPPNRREKRRGPYLTHKGAESQDEWGLSSNSTVGYVDSNIGATVRQTML